MQYAADPCLPSRPSDDDGLLGAFLGGGFDLRSDHGGLSDLPSSHQVQNLMPCHGGASLSVSDGFMGLDTADMLASVTGALDDGLLDTFAYGSDVVAAAAEEPAQPTASSNAFSSGYSSTTGGNYGNISSGESNTCSGGGGGHDTEVASPCALSRSSALPQATAALASKRKLGGKYPAVAATTSTEAQVAAPWRGAKRDSATSSSSTSITFAAGHGDHHAAGGSSSSAGGGYEYEPDSEALAQVKEMIYRAAAMRPVHQLVCGAGTEPAPSSQSKPRRKNVRISSDPQTVAARLRRERVSERLRVLQRLVPGGSRMDTASMLDEAASYLKFLKTQVKALERANPSNGGYHNSSLLPQSYTGTGSLGVGGGGTGVANGRDGAIDGYVNSNRNMHL